ncbi:hypothetical protein Q1695_010766 [Nippostrongylus brasiliensis]|nr:hypothetical protein Q1695_010766 [Nippostrongylus brasiliensis]
MSLKDSVWRLLFTVNSAGFLLMSAVILVVDSIATSHGGLTGSLSKFFNGIRTKINVAETLFALFSANLIGISFARSLHYQFYSWYYHQLPFLLFWDSSRTSDRPTLTFVVSILMKALVLVGVEICWNVYPSTVASAFLNLYHISILVYLFLDYFERSELTKKAN